MTHFIVFLLGNLHVFHEPVSYTDVVPCQSRLLNVYTCHHMTCAHQISPSSARHIPLPIFLTQTRYQPPLRLLSLCIHDALCSGSESHPREPLPACISSNSIHPRTRPRELLAACSIGRDVPFATVEWVNLNFAVGRRSG
jgi:hypothetical protein